MKTTDGVCIATGISNLSAAKLTGPREKSDRAYRVGAMLRFSFLEGYNHNWGRNEGGHGP
jgi:hypothetical protein